MQPSQQQKSRINLIDLKVQIVKKLGSELSSRYFYNLNRLLNQKLSKSEFDESCFRILGKENLPLHNQLIRSILKNACLSKVPPPTHEKEAPGKNYLEVGVCSPAIGDGHEQAGSSLSRTQSPPLFWSNGNVLTGSPRKSRSGVCERRPKDRLDQPSPLGPNGKIIIENGNLNSCNLQRLVHHNKKGLAEQPETEFDALLHGAAKRPRTKKPLEDVPVSVNSKGPVIVSDLILSEKGDERDVTKNSTNFRNPLSAPLGIPFCSASIGGSCRASPLISNTGFASSVDNGELPDFERLRKRMEQIAREQGIEGISNDCTNLLNNGLDVYLKRLIRSCIELVGARTGHELGEANSYKQQPHGNTINGRYPVPQLQLQSSSGYMTERVQDFKTHCSVSLLDFKAAMELKPQQLGEDWPLMVEKICLRSYEE